MKGEILFDTQPEVVSGKSNSSASITSENTYSAKELAEMYLTSRPSFLALNDLERHTLNWNQNYIFDMLYYIKDESTMDLLISWLTIRWEESHVFWESRDNAANGALHTEKIKFEKETNYTKELVLQKIASEKKKEELYQQMMTGYKQPTQTPPKVQEIKDETEFPQFGKPNVLPTPQYHIADLPQDVQHILTFSDDETYSLFVTTMREDTWLIVATNKQKYLDRLRFVCRKFNIIGKNTGRKEFDKLIHYVISDLGDIGNLESAMKKQTDSNDDKNLKYYDSPIYNHRCKCKELCEVGYVLEESLTPVLEKIHGKKWDIHKNPR